MPPVTAPTDPAGRPELVLAAVLAAGAGTRYTADHHKLTARLPDGRSVAAHAIGAARESAIGPVAVVLGPAPIELSADVIEVVNPDWAAGQATSLQAALALAARLGAAALVVGLADQPLVPAEAWRRVAASAAPIAVATYADSGPDAARNPVRLHRSVWGQLPRTGDRGARELIRLHPELVERVPCPGSADDLDRPEDLTRLEQRWQSKSSTNSS